MARLEAVAKMLFFPTPDRIVSILMKMVRLKFEPGATLLDPCAGRGDAAACLAKAWGLKSYGVELDRDRAEAASLVMDHVLHGSFHQLKLATFSVVLLNPPYDNDGSDDDGSLRQEVSWLFRAAEFLAPRGLLIFIVPRKILSDYRFETAIQKSFCDVRAWEFPHPESESFDQVVVIARRRDPNQWGYHVFHLGEIGVLGSEVFEGGPVPSVPTGAFEIDESLPAPPVLGESPTGAYASPRWGIMMTDRNIRSETPLVAPRPGHQAMLLAAGCLDGAEIGDCLMKGGSFKVTVELTTEDERIKQERIVSYLSSISLSTGDLETWRVDEDPIRTSKWFENHGDDLAAAILSGHTPSFNGDLSGLDFSKLRAPGILPGRSEPEILEIQRQAAAAVVHRWRDHKSVIICGEQGTGKTTMANVAIALSGAKKTIIICPTHLVSKWVHENAVVFGDPRASRFAKRCSDVDAFFADPSARCLVVSKEMAKLGARWAPAYSTRRMRIVEESRVRRDQWSQPEIVKKIRVKRCITCSHCGSLYLGAPVESMNSDLRRKCGDCGEPMWTSLPLSSSEEVEETTPKKKGKGKGKGKKKEPTKRWPLARYIATHYARRYRLVIDEVHQFAGAESDQGRAVQVLGSSSLKILALTGTLYGGRASSIFHLLYRIDHGFRQSYKHNECARFVAHHGLFETVQKIDRRTSTFNYSKGSSGGRVREIPGMSPAMIPMLLAYTIFVKLKDLRVELPPYSEEVELVDHDPLVQAEAMRFASEIQGQIRHNPKILGAYIQACLGYPDRPDQAEAIEGLDDDGSPILIASAKAFPSQIWPKDLRTVEICVAEREAGRKSMVFFSQTKRRDARGRVKAALEAKGLRVAVLESSVQPDKRIQWLASAEAKGFDVLLTNGKLVETGLDLLFAHTIIQYGIEYNLSVLRQSIRRSWRLGQTKPIRVVFLGYRNTIQSLALDLIAKKMRAAEMIDGEENGGLAQHDVGGANFLVELAHHAIEMQGRSRRVRRTA